MYSTKPSFPVILDDVLDPILFVLLTLLTKRPELCLRRDVKSENFIHLFIFAAAPDWLVFRCKDM